MKKAIALILTLSMSLALCACGGEGADPSIPDRASASFVGGSLGASEQTEQTEQPVDAMPTEKTVPEATPTETTPPETQPAQSAQQFSNDAGTSIDVLREEIDRAGAAFGVAYIGYFEYFPETGIDFSQWYMGASSPLAANYPFAAEIDENHTVGSQGHLYCILAKAFDATITVTTPDDRTLYRAENGDPILVFCNQTGDAAQGDITVEIESAEGASYAYTPTLDQLGFPQLLIGAERQLLSWDFTPIADTGFDADSWLAEGWMGMTDVGLAYDENGLTWQYTTWDGSRTYSLTFWLIDDESYDGELLLECDGADGSVLGQWQGLWRVETAIDQPTRLWLEMMWTGGSNQAEFAAASVVSESCLAMIPFSGENLLLAAENTASALPFFRNGEWSMMFDLAAE